MKIYSLGAELFHANGQAGRHTQGNNRFCCCCNFAKAPKNYGVSAVKCRPIFVFYFLKITSPNWFPCGVCSPVIVSGGVPYLHTATQLAVGQLQSSSDIKFRDQTACQGRSYSQ